MVRFTVGTLILAAATLPRLATAQDFEGTVTVRLTATAPNGATGVGAMIMDIKGTRTATTTRLIGQEAHIVTDLKAGTRTIWLPKPADVHLPAELVAAGAINGLVFVMPLKKPATTMPTPGRGPASVQLRKLGTTETIAGMGCDDYEMIDQPQGVLARTCATTALGRFTFPDGSNTGSRTVMPSWVSAFDDQALFPLKVWTLDGKNELEVVSIRRRAIPDSVFVVPPGYLDMVKYQARANAGRGL